MESFQRFIDLRCPDNDPELFAIALAIRHIRELINYGGSDIGRPDDDSALDPNHLEAFLTRAVEMTWKNRRFVQEWRRMQQVLPHVKEAWERGQILFQKALDRAKSDQEDMEYFSMIDFAVDCYAYVSASRSYPDNSMLRNWAINGYMLLWRGYFLKDQDGEKYMEDRL
jgi:hypothetical protein